MTRTYILSVFLLFKSVSGLVSVKIDQLGYSYTAPLQIFNVFNGTSNSSTYNCMVDTGNFAFTTSFETIPYSPTTAQKNVCTALTEDGSNVVYVHDSNHTTCQTDNDVISLNTATANVSRIDNTQLMIQNARLHQWAGSQGDLGMTYCQNYGPGGCVEYSAFEQLIINSTTATLSNPDDPSNSTSTYEHLIFGLNFNDINSPFTSISSVESSLQLGDVLPEYQSTIQYLQQPIEDPDYHMITIENLDFCTNENMFFPYSTNWQVLVDTGSVCLTLPEEIYNSFAGYFDNSTTFTDMTLMPVFKFKVNSGSFNSTNSDTTVSSESSTDNFFYIPLASLLVNSSAISENMEGAPYVTVMDAMTGLNTTYRLCILSGNGIETNSGDYYNPAPVVVFGSLVLRSMYFTADFATRTVGLANKLSASEIAGFQSITQGCKAIVTCIGEQKYKSQTNSCEDPKCEKYFFVETDWPTMTCVYKQSNLVGGLIFVLLIALCEVVSYFVVQYSTVSIVDTQSYGLNTPGQLNSFLFHRGMDPLTLKIGAFFAQFVDVVLMYGLKWIVMPDPGTNDGQRGTAQRVVGQNAGRGVGVEM